LRGRNHRIRRNESSQRAIVPARAVKIKPKLRLFPLTGELVVRAEIAGGEARLPKRLVERGRSLDSAGIGGDTAAAEVVTEQVGQRPVRADGETRRAREVILGDNRAFVGFFIA